MPHPFAASQHADRRFDRLELPGETVTSREFIACAFVDCRFPETAFDTCRFVDCTFRGCDLSMARVPNCAFTETVFENCRLAGVNWAEAAWRKGRLLEAIRFQGCALNHGTFIGLSLPGLKVIDCATRDVDFREADLSRASFSGTDLAESLFQHTNLTGADLSRARNYAINPALNTLTGARFALPEAMALLYSMDIELVE